MEDTPGDHQAKIESKKSTGSQDGASSSCTSTHISSDNNSCAKTLIEYDMDESLDIKEEIVQDEEVHQRGKRHLHSGKNQSDKKRITTVSSDNNSGVKALIKDMHAPLIIKEEIIQDQQTESESNKSTGSQDVGPSFCTPTPISSANNSGAKTLIEYDIDESLDIKEEILEDQQTMIASNKSAGRQDGRPSSCTPTHISSDNNSTAKTLIEYDIDESLDIKEEIVEDPERHQQMGHSLLSGKKQWDGKCITTEVLCDNNSRPKTLIESEDDETLEIMEDIIRDPKNIEQGPNKKYESELSTLNRVADITTFKKPWTSRKKNIQESKSEPKRKYNCEKCARSYTQKWHLNRHKKFECDVIPQFRCNFCDKKFKQKSNMNVHIVRVHQKTNKKASQMRHKCNKCSRSYSFPSSLSDHKRAEHALVKPQFICDCCGFRTKRKQYMSQHFTYSHCPKMDVSIMEPGKKYNCEKCARSYTRKRGLNTHQKFDCGVMPQFRCESCGKKFKRKSHIYRHILCVHQKTNIEATEMRHNCNKCSRSYSFLSALNDHKRAEHTAVKPQFICDYCGFETKRKKYLFKHITSQHLNL